MKKKIPSAKSSMMRSSMTSRSLSLTTLAVKLLKKLKERADGPTGRRRERLIKRLSANLLCVPSATIVVASTSVDVVVTIKDAEVITKVPLTLIYTGTIISIGYGGYRGSYNNRGYYRGNKQQYNRDVTA